MKKDSNNYHLYLDKLKNSNNFSGLSDDDLKELLGNFYVETWSKGQLSFDSNKTLHTFYFVVSGRIKIYKFNPDTGNEYILNLNSSGDVFDVICLLDGKKHDVEIEALDDVTLLAAPIQTVRDWIIKHPDFNKVILPYLASKLREMEDKANDLALLDTWSRTLKLFVTNTRTNIQGSELQLINNLTHSEIANIIGTSKNVINRHIQRLKENGILHINRKQIHINNFEKLLIMLNEHKYK